MNFLQAWCFGVCLFFSLATIKHPTEEFLWWALPAEVLLILGLGLLKLK